jgi:hypothetical protein
LGPGIDTRAQGGYVVLPPSVHPSGRPYAWRPGRDPWTTPPASLPAWLLEKLTTPIDRKLDGDTVGGSVIPPGADRAIAMPGYVGAALRRASWAVATAPPGRRNDTLNREAYALARFLPGGRLRPEQLAAALAVAAIRAGLKEREIGATLASALRARGLHHG